MADLAASRNYNEGRPGFYAVNPETQIAVAGPFKSESEAAAVCLRENNRVTVPPAPDPLWVYEVSASV